MVASTLDKILSGILTSPPDALLKTLDWVSQTHLNQMFRWNERCAIEPVERCIHDVIADQVLARPDAEAVCAWDGSFTYRQLDDAASCLAIRLVSLGVGPEVLVTLCFSKSVSCRLSFVYRG